MIFFLVAVYDDAKLLPGCSILYAGRAVGAMLVCDQHARHAPTLEKLIKEPLGSSLITARLKQDIKSIAIPVDSTPQPTGLSIDLDDTLIQMPLIIGSWPVAPDFTGKVMPELVHPDPDRLIRQ